MPTYRHEHHIHFYHHRRRRHVFRRIHDWWCGDPPVLARILFHNPKTGVNILSYAILSSQTATIPIKGADQNGNPIALASDTSVSSSDSSILEVTLGADGTSIVLNPLKGGDAVVTVTSGGISSTLDVEVSDPVIVPVPVLTTIIFDTANAVVTDKAPAAPADGGPAPVDPSSSPSG